MDRKEVKRAYSRQLKKTRPEDDPEGFMQLREAHDTALNILTRRAEDAAWEAQQSAEQTPSVEAETPAPKKTSEPGLSYSDMIPEAEPDTPSATSYAIGPTPTLDAPALSDYAEIDMGQAPEAPREPPLQQDIIDIFSHGQYNHRENWNQLFRKARQLDIDDYVDFETLLMDYILRFHGYYDNDTPHFDQLEKLPQKLSPSISASLFKTMSWDQVSGLTYQKAAQIDWLNRRMQMSRTPSSPINSGSVPPAHAPTTLARWFWPMLGGLMALALLADFLTT